MRDADHQLECAVGVGRTGSNVAVQPSVQRRRAAELLVSWLAASLTTLFNCFLPLFRVVNAHDLSRAHGHLSSLIQRVRVI